MANKDSAAVSACQRPTAGLSRLKYQVMRVLDWRYRRFSGSLEQFAAVERRDYYPKGEQRMFLEEWTALQEQRSRGGATAPGAEVVDTTAGAEAATALGAGAVTAPGGAGAATALDGAGARSRGRRGRSAGGSLRADAASAIARRSRCSPSASPRERSVGSRGSSQARSRSSCGRRSRSQQRESGSCSSGSSYSSSFHSSPSAIRWECAKMCGFNSTSHDLVEEHEETCTWSSCRLKGSCFRLCYVKEIWPTWAVILFYSFSI
jgi:hypothetical protein